MSEAEGAPEGGFIPPLYQASFRTIRSLATLAIMNLGFDNDEAAGLVDEGVARLGVDFPGSQGIQRQRTLAAVAAHAARVHAQAQQAIEPWQSVLIDGGEVIDSNNLTARRDLALELRDALAYGRNDLAGKNAVKEISRWLEPTLKSDEEELAVIGHLYTWAVKHVPDYLQAGTWPVYGEAIALQLTDKLPSLTLTPGRNPRDAEEIAVRTAMSKLAPQLYFTGRYTKMGLAYMLGTTRVTLDKWLK